MNIIFTDGTVKVNPILYGGGWYLHWTEDGICEFVIKCFSKSTYKSCLRRMKWLLNKIGMSYKVGEFSETSRSFPPYWGASVQAYSFELDIKNIEIPISMYYQLS